MMVGAVGWGVVSDIVGRALPFHSTLLLTALFGIGASFASSFAWLCVWLFFLGTAVGGSMPTDGTLFLENLPHSKQYLLTLLSVFFSFGAVLSATTGFALLPQRSCKTHEGCDIAGGANDGWRHVLLALGCIVGSMTFLLCACLTLLQNLLCALARFVILKLHESPRFLVANGRSNEAVVVLRNIANFNDHTLDIEPVDVRPQLLAGDSSIIVDEEQRALMPDMLSSPSAPRSPHTPRSPHRGRCPGRASSGRWAWFHTWCAQMAKLFSPKWRRTVITMWIIWGAMAFAFTMFNVWLPAVLESRQGKSDDAIHGALRDVVLYSVAGCPGSLVSGSCCCHRWRLTGDRLERG